MANSPASSPTKPLTTGTSPLIWATGLVLVLPLLPLTFVAAVLYVREFFQGWIPGRSPDLQSPMMAVAAFASIQLVAFLDVALLASIPWIRRTLTPRWTKQSVVRQRALEQFIARGLTNTKKRTGVLLYVSLKDKCADLVTDIGIRAKIAPEAWRDPIRSVVRALRRGHAAAGIVEAIRACSVTIKTNFPVQVSDRNELSDTPAESPRKAEALNAMIDAR